MRDRPAFLVTVDTEADDEWSPPTSSSYRGVEALGRLQDLCDRYGVRPTYLVTYDVAASDACQNTLVALNAGGRCEIGAHLHAWRTPPFSHSLDQLPDRQPYLHEYPPELRCDKLRQLTSFLSERIGTRPVSYRGGRWSIDEVTVRELVRLGYVADTTVTPYETWEQQIGARLGGMNYLLESVEPRQLPVGHSTSPSGWLVEVPVTIGIRGRMSGQQYTGLLSRCGRSRVSSATLRRLMRLLAGVRVVWMHPVHSTVEDMCWLVERVLRRPGPVLNMVFHSSELVSGGAPHVRTQKDAERVWARISGVLAVVAQRPDVEPMTLTEFAYRWRAGVEDEPARPSVRAQ